GDVQIVDGRYYVADELMPEGSIIHLRGEPPYRGGHGNGVITTHWMDLGLAITTRRYTAGQYASGGPAGYLKSPQPLLEAADARRFRGAWRQPRGRAPRSTAVLTPPPNFPPIQLPPLAPPLPPPRQWSLRDVALSFGIPPYMLGVPGDSSTYANVESR